MMIQKIGNQNQKTKKINFNAKIDAPKAFWDVISGYYRPLNVESQKIVENSLKAILAVKKPKVIVFKIESIGAGIEKEYTYSATKKDGTNILEKKDGDWIDFLSAVANKFRNGKSNLELLIDKVKK